MLKNIIATLMAPVFILKIFFERIYINSVIKVRAYNLLGAKIHKTVVFQKQVRLYGIKNISISPNCFFGDGVRIVSYDAEVKIGENCLIASDCIIITRGHNFQELDIPIKEQGYTNKSVTIENNVWLGYRVIILPGVTIGEGAIIAANSVITKDIAPYTINGGVPARKIKDRDDK